MGLRPDLNNPGHDPIHITQVESTRAYVAAAFREITPGREYRITVTPSATSDVTIGAVWTLRSQLPWNATAGRDLNGDGFNTDLVPGTTRNAGSRDLSLDAVNAWRAVNGLTPIRESDIDSSRINIVDLRASKSLRLGGPLRLELVAQIFNLFNTTNLQAQYGGGRVGNALSASFGRILTARPGTQGELAAKISW